MYNGKQGVVRVYALDDATGDWSTYGPAIEGEAGTTGQHGKSISVSGDGTNVAIGAPYSGGNNEGKVRVYKYNTSTNTWVQRGAAIVGPSLGDMLGYSVALDDDASTLAIGAIQEDIDSGYAVTYGWNETNSEWVQRGRRLNLVGRKKYIGHSIALSADGSIIAVGMPEEDSAGFGNNGKVQIYHYDDTNADWVQMGSDFVGQGQAVQLGYDVDLSASGDTVVIGIPWDEGSNAVVRAGKVNVYRFSNATDEWVQLGDSVLGDSMSTYLGKSVAISDDGTTIAAGAPWYSLSGEVRRGQAKVFTYNDGSGTWEQVGMSLYGETRKDEAGESISLAGDGSALAIGARYNDYAGLLNSRDHRGHVRVFNFGG